MYFTIPVDHREKIKKGEKIDKDLDLAGGILGNVMASKLD